MRSICKNLSRGISDERREVFCSHVFFLSESEEGNFGLYVVKETGETRRIGESEFPLLLRYRYRTQKHQIIFSWLNSSRPTRVSEVVCLLTGFCIGSSHFRSKFTLYIYGFKSRLKYNKKMCFFHEAVQNRNIFLSCKWNPDNFQIRRWKGHPIIRGKASSRDGFKLFQTLNFSAPPLQSPKLFSSPLKG